MNNKTKTTNQQQSQSSAGLNITKKEVLEELLLLKEEIKIKTN